MPGPKYATVIIYIPIRKSTVYLSVLHDLCNGEIVSYKISKYVDATLSTDVVNKLALSRDIRGVRASMLGKKNYWDNAMAENNLQLI